MYLLFVYGSLGVGREQKFEKHKREMFAWFSGEHTHTHTLPDSFLKLALLRTFLAKTCNSELFCCVRNLVRAHIILDELLSCSFAASPNTLSGERSIMRANEQVASSRRYLKKVLLKNREILYFGAFSSLSASAESQNYLG